MSQVEGVEFDPVKRPSHYNKGPKHYACGQPIEAINITEAFPANVAQALKYILRHQHKGKPEEDLRKAQTFLQFELDRLKREAQ